MDRSRYLEITDLGKTYDTPSGPAVIVKDFTLHIPAGQFVSIIGQSGCGKSTVLSMIMGLVKPTTGAMGLAGTEITGPGIDRGVVFQTAALLPWYTAVENVMIAVAESAPLESRAERRERARASLALVGLEGQEGRYPDELSAGMKQRVSIARAFAIDPHMLLLDEPFSLLDVLTRMELQDELLRIWEKTRKTVVMITHDVDEALLLSDRIVMMTRGPEAKIGRIMDVSFPRPRNREALENESEYFKLRDELVSFLET